MVPQVSQPLSPQSLIPRQAWQVLTSPLAQGHQKATQPRLTIPVDLPFLGFGVHCLLPGGGENKVWPEIQGQLRLNPGLEAKSIFADLPRRCRGRFQDGQLRTFQRQVRKWRVLEGRPQEVFFPRDDRPIGYASLISLT